MNETKCPLRITSIVCVARSPGRAHDGVRRLAARGECRRPQAHRRRRAARELRGAGADRRGQLPAKRRPGVLLHAGGLARARGCARGEARGGLRPGSERAGAAGQEFDEIVRAIRSRRARRRRAACIMRRSCSATCRRRCSPSSSRRCRKARRRRWWTVVYLYCPNGYGERFEQRLLREGAGARATTRNWRTVRALQALAPSSRQRPRPSQPFQIRRAGSISSPARSPPAPVPARRARRPRSRAGACRAPAPPRRQALRQQRAEDAGQHVADAALAMPGLPAFMRSGRRARRSCCRCLDSASPSGWPRRRAPPPGVFWISAVRVMQQPAASAGSA